MKVLMLDTREVLEVEESWGSRLFEQGLAILPPTEPPVVEQAEPEGEEPEEKPAKKASKK